MRRLRKNKKASILDFALIVGVAVTVLAVMSVVFFKVTDEINTKIQGQDRIPDEGKQAMGNVKGMFSGVLDNSFLFLMVGLSIGAIVLAGLVRIHPIFIAFFFIVWILIVFFCGIFSNMYQEVANNPQLITLANELTFMNTIMSKLPLLVGILGGLLCIIMYKTWRVSDFG